MHGVPRDLDLAQFKDATLVQICIGEYQLQFRFDPEGTISVEGIWELRNASGVLLDKAQGTNEQRDAYRVHAVLGKKVVRCSVNAPRSISLKFDSGHLLTLFDDSREHESFSIQPGNIHV